MPASLQQSDEIKYLKLSCTREVHSEPYLRLHIEKNTYACLQEEEEKDTKKESLRLIAESEAFQENGSYLLSHCYAVP
ncbi:hypothetical protein, partial [uncultured Bacteroides sp.]|uniref:hypothetical protein n=1 Tax=uncultured Bacteroides sp. TaxID=162156 RepID=UPI0025DD8946